MSPVHRKLAARQVDIMQHVLSLLVAFSHVSAAGSFTELKIVLQSQGPRVESPQGVTQGSDTSCPAEKLPFPMYFGSAEAVAGSGKPSRDFL